MTRRIAISAGHAEDVRGASGYIDEFDENVRVVNQIFNDLKAAGVQVVMYVDTISKSQNENLNRIADWHNQQQRDLDVQIHFNASSTTSKPMGCEVLWVTQETLAAEISAAIADVADWPDRGAKYRSDLYWLNSTSKPAVLIETCFCDSSSDANVYRAKFGAICKAIGESIADIDIPTEPVEPPEPVEPDPPVVTGENRVDIAGNMQGDVSIYINGVLVKGHEPCEHVVNMTIAKQGDVVVTINGEEFHNSPFPVEPLFRASGPCSWFGGPDDQGVAPDEGLAFIYSYDAAPHLFLSQQPPGTTGLARRLDTDNVNYVACRWDYDVTPKDMLADKSIQALVRANGREILAWPADWGPNEATGRVADLSRALLNALDLETDDPVEVIYPAQE